MLEQPANIVVQMAATTTAFPANGTLRSEIVNVITAGQ